MKDITPQESVDRILDQAEERAKAQLSRHKQSLKELKEKKRDTKTMEKQVKYYEDQIEEIRSRKKRGK